MTAAGAIGEGDLLDGLTVKFLSPVRPGDRVRVSWQATGDGMIRFECAVGDDRVANGAFRARAPTVIAGAAGADPAAGAD